MGQRGAQLSQTADRQITELVDVLSAPDGNALSQPCPGREKLGDGSVAACSQHLADNYHRIGAFVAGRSVPGHGEAHRHHMSYDAKRVSLTALLERLADARPALAEMVNLTDEQLDSGVPEVVRFKGLELAACPFLCGRPGVRTLGVRCERLYPVLGHPPRAWKPD